MSASGRGATRSVDCSTCGRKADFSPANRWRPFCSQRCRMVDLGAWASGAYVVPGAPLDVSSDAQDETRESPRDDERR